MSECPDCGGEGFVYTTHYADPYSTTRRCHCQDPDPDERHEREKEQA